MLCGEGKIPALFLFVLGVCCFAGSAGVAAAAWTETYITVLDFAVKGGVSILVGGLLAIFGAVGVGAGVSMYRHYAAQGRGWLYWRPPGR